MPICPQAPAPPLPRGSPRDADTRRSHPQWMILRMSEATVDAADLRHHGGGDSADDRADDAPLRDDIRLLGRVLGEVIGEQAGRDVLDLVEAPRVEAFRIRRSEVDRAELAERLGGLDVKSANHVIR